MTCNVLMVMTMMMMMMMMMMMCWWDVKPYSLTHSLTFTYHSQWSVASVAAAGVCPACLLFHRILRVGLGLVSSGFSKEPLGHAGTRSSCGEILFLCGSVAEWLGSRTCDQQLAGSNPGCHTARCNLVQVVYTHVPLSPSSIIWYQPIGGDAGLLGR